jgi:hypothetical protein
MYWGMSLPRAPGIDRTWGINQRGTWVYLTDREFGLLMAMFGVSLAAFLVMLVIEIAVDPSGRRRR